MVEQEICWVVNPHPSPSQAQVCTETYGFSAEVVCTGNLRASIPYIPIHVDYMCAAWPGRPPPLSAGLWPCSLAAPVFRMHGPCVRQAGTAPAALRSSGSSLSRNGLPSPLHVPVPMARCIPDRPSKLPTVGLGAAPTPWMQSSTRAGCLALSTSSGVPGACHNP